MKQIKITQERFFIAAALIIFTLAALTTTIQAQSAANVRDNLFSISDSPESLKFSPDDSTKFSFQSLAVVNVTNIEELYAAVNNSQNAGNQIVIAPGVYMLSVNDSGGAARPNGGRLELQENMSLRGVAGNRGAVIIDAAALPASSYTTPIANTGAIRMGKGTNAVEWLTVRNAVSGGAGIIVHLSAAGTAYVRIAHCVSTGGHRGIDIRNAGNSPTGFVIEAEIVDNDLHNNRIQTAQGLRIINTGGSSTSVINAYLSGNRMFDNQQGMIVENLGSTNGGIVSVYSSGDRFYENGGGATVGGAFGPTENSTVNFTAVGSVFENNNGFTNFYRGGLSVAGSVSFQTANGGSNNIANVVLRNCRFANNQVADLAAYGASSLPVSIGPSGTNNRANVRLHGTPISNLVAADSNPANPAGINSAKIIRTPVSSDFDGDARADLSVFRPSDRTWYLNRLPTGFTATQFGLATDKLVPADFDGDGKIDIAVFRDGFWYWLGSSNNQFSAFKFGQTGDIPLPADFDGDGRAELVVWRLPQSFTPFWYVYNLANNRVTSAQLGVSDLDLNPVAGDYDGDGRADYVMYNANNTLNWHIGYSGASGGFSVIWGVVGDIPVPADYDGDGKTDVAVFRPADGNWYIRRSSDGNAQIITWGLGTDALVPADYDGDGKTDVAVFRNGVWYIRQTSGGINYVYFGSGGDVPTNQAQ